MATRFDRLFFLFFFALAAVQLLVLQGSALTLAPDEAYYWEWSRRLDLSYYSKGPIIALLIAASTQLLGDTVFAVRLPAFLCSALFSLSFYFFMRREFSPGIAFVSWLAVRSMLIIASTAFAMTTDPATLLFWWLALTAGYTAVRHDRPRAWLWSFFWLGLCVLTKYTAALLFFCQIAFLFFTPSRRAHLRSVPFIGGVVSFFLLLSPIAVWNSKHGWVNLAHNTSHLVSDKGVSFTLRYFFELVGGQLGLVGPVLLPVLVAIIWRKVRAVHRDEVDGYLLFTILPLVAVCLVLSLTKSVYANWPMPAYLGAMVLFGRELESIAKTPARYRWVLRGIGLNWVIVALVHLPLFGFTFGIPGNRLPTKKMAGWVDLASAVDEMRSAVMVASGETPFILADSYATAASLAFALPDHPEVFCAPVPERRMNQYDVWGGLSEQKGRPAIVVLTEREVPAAIRERFDVMEPRPNGVEIPAIYSGAEVKRFYVHLGEGFDGEVPVVSLRR